MSVRVRFAPSPTGYLHIGNVHTALFSWLFARHNGGRFVLRIEDTDVDRSEARYEAAILDELRWLGLDWDEGVDKGGPYGPYRQSERLELYAQYAQRLLDTGHAYWCYCTREEIEAQRDAALREGRAPRYNGHCRRLSEAERRRREQAGIKPVLRFRVPDTGGDIVVEDLIRGPIRFSLADLDDFVLVRSNGVPLYNLAVTVDDLTMRITHIIRAEEHLSNTPRQILIYQALGEAPPVFAHVSMLLGPDRTKLSKRHGAASISEFRGQGYLPEAILNYLALLGWTPPGGQEILSVPEIIRQFDLGRVSHSPAVFDVNKLTWLNGQYIRSMPLGRLLERARPFLEQPPEQPKAGGPDFRPEQSWWENLLGVLRDSLQRLDEIPAQARPFLEPPPELPPPVGAGDSRAEGEAEAREARQIRKILQHPKAGAALDAFLQALEAPPPWEPAALKEWIHALPEKCGLGMGQMMRPLRAALTGCTVGPEIHNVLWLLGPERCRQRAGRARRWVQENVRSAAALDGPTG